jgi:hypothetical protein
MFRECRYDERNDRKARISAGTKVRTKEEDILLNNY